MSLESEARRQLEAQRRTAQEQEESRQKAIRAYNLELAQAKSEAITKFKSLNPERLLEEVKRTWRTGRIVRFTDPLYKDKEVGGDKIYDIDGVMLYQRGNPNHTNYREKGYYAQHEDHQPLTSSGKWIAGNIVDTYTYPVDVARISLVLRQVVMNMYYEVVTEDLSGNYYYVKTRSGDGGLFSSDTYEHINQGHTLSNLSRTPESFDIHNVTYGDIRAFFVSTTASRMAGAGNLKIR